MIHVAFVYIELLINNVLNKINHYVFIYFLQLCICFF